MRNNNTLIFTPAIANITGKRPHDPNVRKLIFKPTGGKKPAQKKGYKIPKTPKVSGVGWGY